MYVRFKGIHQETINKYIGFKNNSLTVVSYSHKVGRDAHYLCNCDCGNTTIVNIYSVKRGSTKSCGCAFLPATIKYNKSRIRHGQSDFPIYKTWGAMKRRCYSPKLPSYKDYGARGISVCTEWMVFDNFFKWAMDNGYSKELTIERINNNGDYEPSNCRWATRKEQTNNRRNNRYIEYNGERLTAAQWSFRLGGQKGIVSNRVNTLGWDEITAVTTPIKRRYEKN